MSLKVKLQYWLPQHSLSRLMGKMAQIEQPTIKNLLIRAFIKRYHVNMTEAIQANPENYKNFNAFFTRALQPNARPMQLNSQQFLSPADGLISAAGDIKANTLLQAKGHNYTLEALLAGDQTKAQNFYNGHFFTIYLAPKDYHRVHMPLTGKLEQMVYVPGKLFSVNTLTTNTIPNLFALNERVICYFSTEHGPMAIILVGAMIVGSMSTEWASIIAPGQQIKTWQYDDNVTINQGAEMGHFQLGSTVIVLLASNKVNWLAQADQTVQMGQSLLTLEN